MNPDSGSFDYRSSGPNAVNGYDVAVGLFDHAKMICHSASVSKD